MSHWTRDLCTESPLVALLAPYRQGFPSAQGAGLRRLLQFEVATLLRQGNHCADWGRVLVAESFRTDWLWNTRLSGNVILEDQEGSLQVDGVSEPCGVTDSALHNVWIGARVVIRRVGLLSGYAVGSGSVVLGCGSVVHDGQSTFGVGSVLRLGLETDGRNVPLVPDLTVEEAAQLAAARADLTLQQEYEAAVRALSAAVRTPLAVIGAGARVLHTPRVESAAIGSCARIVGATEVAHSTVLSGAEEQTVVSSGAVLVSAGLQWGARVERLAVVRESLVGEQTCVSDHARVSASFLGPCSHIAAGEVTASLVGPLTAMHHESLLIGVYWPSGRGNVAYGACCGSNHTSRVPDQEFRPGEGMFLGLNTTVRFPGDWSEAPYCILAAGTTLLPSHIAFPFSLVNGPGQGSPSPSLCEIRPGWVFSENPYMLCRAEAKCRVRWTARRTTCIPAVLRPEIMALVLRARERLAQVGGREFYTRAEIPELGQTYLTEAARAAGVVSYTLCLRLYALRVLWEWARAQPHTSLEDIHRTLRAAPQDPATAMAGDILYAEYPDRDIRGLLAALCEVHTTFAERVQASKAKDDVRGQRTIPGYAEAHRPAAEDPIVVAVWAENAAVTAWVQSLLV